LGRRDYLTTVAVTSVQKAGAEIMKREDATTVIVTVNHERWSRVATFQDAGPDDTVFVLNPQTGTVSFGTGVQGARPPIGSTVSVSYRAGAGAAGNISKRIDDDGDLAKFWVIVRADLQELGWGSKASYETG
jgi:hypothetical protein